MPRNSESNFGVLEGGFGRSGNLLRETKKLSLGSQREPWSLRKGAAEFLDIFVVEILEGTEFITPSDE